ncbi:MAG: hypothetical protein JWQ12_1489 [Glaciihabitans sp.]|nr:hypothetical protein [Glaciihabitans sp.]
MRKQACWDVPLVWWRELSSGGGSLGSRHFTRTPAGCAVSPAGCAITPAGCAITPAACVLASSHSPARPDSREAARLRLGRPRWRELSAQAGVLGCPAGVVAGVKFRWREPRLPPLHTNSRRLRHKSRHPSRTPAGARHNSRHQGLQARGAKRSGTERNGPETEQTRSGTEPRSGTNHTLRRAPRRRRKQRARRIRPAACGRPGRRSSPCGGMPRCRRSTGRSSPRPV